MTIKVGILAASGPSLSDCHALTSRYDEDSDFEGAFEAMLVHGRGGSFYAVQRSQAYRDVWRAPSGRVYVAAYTQMAWSDTPTQGGGGWMAADVDGIVRRVSGVDDGLVFGYGSPGAMYRFDGSDWRPVAAPGLFIDIHGPSADLVYGVGSNGLIARWNGSGWDPVAVSATGAFRNVWVVSADEMYAIHETGLWEGSVHGWAPRLRAERGALLSVAKWKDAVWVGTSDRGLCRLEGDQLVTVKANLAPLKMDARGALLTVQSDLVAATEDGERFREWKHEHAVQLWAQQAPPAWLR